MSKVWAAFYAFVFVSEIWDKKLSYDSTVVGSIPQQLQRQHSLPLDMNPKILKLYLQSIGFRSCFPGKLTMDFSASQFVSVEEMFLLSGT